MARTIMIIGAVLLIGGALYQYFPWLFTWFGRLPGDIRIESERGFIFFPMTSMIILSVLFSIVLNLIRR